MLRKVVVTAPTRIDLAGGTLDLWPIHNLIDEKLTVNCSIALNARSEVGLSTTGMWSVRSLDQQVSAEGTFKQIVEQQDLPLVGLMVKALWRADLPALDITTSAESPAGAGLGGSSALAITIGAGLLRMRKLMGFPVDEAHERLVQTVQDVESRLIFAPTGCQDYWGAVRGGINLIEFPSGPVRVTTLRTRVAEELAEQALIVYSGRSRASACNNWQIFKKLFDGDRALLEAFQEIGHWAVKCGRALQVGNLDAALEASAKEWEIRCGLWPDIETPETQGIDRAARKAGAKFSRVCGAGGGGVLVVFVEPGQRSQVAQAVTDAGGHILDAQLGGFGLQVEERPVVRAMERVAPSRGREAVAAE